ncbi:MAG: hypothetical protein AAB503_00240 [Patescibacteria group bacterium]
MKKHLANIGAAILLIGVLFSIKAARATESPVQKALDDVKGTFDSLINAKDENNPQELSFRIETYKKVIDFSITEAKDLKVRLLSIDPIEKDLLVWKKSVLENIGKALEYYDSQNKLFSDKEKTIATIEQLKELAKNFKEERDSKFSASINQIKDFIMTTQEKESIEVAKSRLGKIQEDVNKLQKARIKNINELVNMLGKAKILIDVAQGLSKEADGMFTRSIIVVSTTSTNELVNASSTETTSSTLIKIKEETTLVSTSTTATSTDDTIGNSALIITTTTVVSASSTPSNATSTEVTIITTTQSPSIKDLVKNSLMKIKEAYQVFIEMSSLVRKGLK